MLLFLRSPSHTSDVFFGNRIFEFDSILRQLRGNSNADDKCPGEENVLGQESLRDEMRLDEQ